MTATYVSIGVSLWAICALFAVAFIHGANRKIKHTNRQRTLSVPKSEG